MTLSKMVLTRVKARLKSKGLNYRFLAGELDVAESTVKRWFSSGSVSLGQLDQICGILGIGLDELLQSAEPLPVREDFSKKQEEFLARNETALALFYLVSAGASREKIERKFTFTRMEIEKGLLLLDQFEIIELHPGGRIRPLKKIGTWWDPRGPLSRKYYILIKSSFVMSDFSKDREEQWYFSGRLSASSQALISRKINKLAVEIRDLYRMDQDDSSAPNITLFCGMRPWAFPVLEKYRRRC
jgi:transcriptional regulator with XRE-family HTH domain